MNKSTYLHINSEKYTFIKFRRITDSMNLIIQGKE